MTSHLSEKEKTSLENTMKMILKLTEEESDDDDDDDDDGWGQPPEEKEILKD